MQKVFQTPYGIVFISVGSFITDSEDNTIVQYECKVATNTGIITTPSIFLGVDEQLTQKIVEQAASTITTKGRTTNRAKNYQIREFLKFQKFNY